MKSLFLFIFAIGFVFTVKAEILIFDEAQLQGVWVQEGYGRIVRIGKKKIEVFDITRVSCLPNLVLPIKYLGYIGEVSHLSEDSLVISAGINQMDFRRISAMPDICQASKIINEKDPIFNFESIWHTFNEQYCAFDKRGVDWDDIYEKYRPQVKSTMSDIDFFFLIENMLDELKDGHVGIEKPNKLESQYEARMAANSPAPKSDSQLTNTQLKVSARKSILKQYVLGSYNEYNKGVLRWGKMKNEMVYLQINAMERWADFGLSDKLKNSAFWKAYLKKENKLVDPLDKNLEGTNRIMGEILNSNKDASAYILDVRFNGGGSDEVALAIMNHFVTDKQPVFTKKGRNGDGYTRSLTAHVVPAATTFTGPVYVLTSVETASAAEIMTMAAKAMSNVTLIGTATEGIFSDILEKQMPNGWSYGLSNEIYETMDGFDFESKGVPPDCRIEYRRWTRGFLEDITADLKDGDDAIVKAIQLFEGL